MIDVHWVLGQVKALVWMNRFWMTWNLALAMLPAVIAVPLFRYEGRRGAGWWAGLVAFVLFLPNAPYVVTDLIHLPGDASWVASKGAVLVGVLPLYGLFVFFGLTAYVAALHEVDGWLARDHRDRWRVPVQVLLHVVSSVGVVLGRVGRLNSWETVTAPGTTATRAADTLSWAGTPVRFLVVLAATWLGFLAVRAFWRGAWRLRVAMPRLP